MLVGVRVMSAGEFPDGEVPRRSRDDLLEGRVVGMARVVQELVQAETYANGAG